MKNEADFKSAFKRSVKAQGGFAISLAAPMLAGIPDLYVIMPGYAPLMLEAKWLKEIKTNNFCRKIAYSKMQLNYLNDINSVKDYTAMGLLGWKRDNKYWCTIQHPKFEYLDNMAINEGIYTYLMNKSFDVISLLDHLPIPRLNGAHASP